MVKNLPEATVEQEVPVICRSTVLSVDSESYRSTTFQPFIYGIKVPITFEHNIRAMVVNISFDDKLIKEFLDVKYLGDLDQLPFFCTIDYIKFVFDYKEDQDLILLSMDGEDYG